MVTWGLTILTLVFPCTKHITGEETIKILLEESFSVYGAPKELNLEEDVRVCSHTGWYKRVLRSLNVKVSKGVPYTHWSKPLCGRKIRVRRENVRIWCKIERTNDLVKLLHNSSLTMTSHSSPATGYSHHELFMGCLACLLHAFYSEDSYSTVGRWVEQQQDKVDKARATLQLAREPHWSQKNKQEVPASYQERDWLLVHHSLVPDSPRSTRDDPYFGPYKILSVDSQRITLRYSPRPAVRSSTTEALLRPRGSQGGRIRTKRQGYPCS